MILKKILPKYYTNKTAKIFSSSFEINDPKLSMRLVNERHAYALKDFTYSFNNWAFRGEDYNQYKGKPVNICLGDSFTVNTGGPIEHSWPSQLSTHFNIPTLNFGVQGAGNDTIRIIYEYLLTVFDVQNVFVMYSFFHRRHDSHNKKLKQDVYSDKENFDFFEKNKINDAYYVFLPPWCWSDTEKEYINHYHENHQCYNIKTYDSSFLNNNRFFFTSLEKYSIIQGHDWPSYKDFINGVSLTDNLYKEIFVTRFNDLLDLYNRDGFHLNYIGNKIVCDYFLNRFNCIP